MQYAPAALARQLDQLCIKIGNEVADDRGFVPIRDLLRRFQVQLIVRPLLVEGMLATVDSVGDAARSSQWAVLIDSEMHALNDESIRSESSERPLHVRARNTIAHELAHSLAFRASEFGIGTVASGRAKASADLVKIIERETERLSPLLLVTEKALRQFASTSSHRISATEVTSLRERLGVSREVFVSRLQMLRSNDETGLLEHTHFRNVAVGIADWTGQGAVLRSWPLLVNFDRNVVPDFLLQTLRQERSRAGDLDISRSSSLCNGLESEVTFECDSRSRGALTPERMAVTVDVEKRERSSQNSIFVVRKVEPAPTSS
jgi:hypothetical protein